MSKALEVRRLGSICAKTDHSAPIRILLAHLRVIYVAIHVGMRQLQSQLAAILEDGRSRENKPIHRLDLLNSLPKLWSYYIFTK